MVNALAIYDEMDTPSLAEAMFKSGLFSDTKSLAQAVVKVLAGRELGLGPVAAMRGIDIIQGKVALSASLTAALVKQTGRYTYYVVAHDEKVCSIEFHERDALTGGWSPIGTSTFTMEMAKRANLEGKDVWRNYPEAMLWARAMTQGAGWYCPDATEGRFYTAEELGSDEPEEDRWADTRSVSAVIAGDAEPTPARDASTLRIPTEIVSVSSDGKPPIQSESPSSKPTEIGTLASSRPSRTEPAPPPIERSGSDASSESRAKSVGGTSGSKPTMMTTSGPLTSDGSATPTTNSTTDDSDLRRAGSRLIPLSRPHGADVQASTVLFDEVPHSSKATPDELRELVAVYGGPVKAINAAWTQFGTDAKTLRSIAELTSEQVALLMPVTS